MKQHERGEIATLLTIGTLVVIGVTAVVSSLFVNRQQTTSSKAAGCVGSTEVTGEAATDTCYNLCTENGGTYVSGSQWTEGLARHCCCKISGGGSTDCGKNAGDTCCPDNTCTGQGLTCQSGTCKTSGSGSGTTNCTGGPQPCTTVSANYTKGQYWTIGSKMYKDDKCNSEITEGVGNYCKSLNAGANGGTNGTNTVGCCNPDWGECTQSQGAKKCNIPNGSCTSGFSCNDSPNGTFYKRCMAVGQCVNQPCLHPPCTDECTAHSQCTAASGGDCIQHNCSEVPNHSNYTGNYWYKGGRYYADAQCTQDKTDFGIGAWCASLQAGSNTCKTSSLYTNTAGCEQVFGAGNCRDCTYGQTTKSEPNMNPASYPNCTGQPWQTPYSCNQNCKAPNTCSYCNSNGTIMSLCSGGTQSPCYGKTQTSCSGYSCASGTPTGNKYYLVEGNYYDTSCNNITSSINTHCCSGGGTAAQTPPTGCRSAAQSCTDEDCVEAHGTGYACRTSTETGHVGTWCCTGNGGTYTPQTPPTGCRSAAQSCTNEDCVEAHGTGYACRTSTETGHVGTWCCSGGGGGSNTCTGHELLRCNLDYHCYYNTAQTPSTQVQYYNLSENYYVADPCTAKNRSQMDTICGCQGGAAAPSDVTSCSDTSTNKQTCNNTYCAGVVGAGSQAANSNPFWTKDAAVYGKVGGTCKSSTIQEICGCTPVADTCSGTNTCTGGCNDPKKQCRVFTDNKCSCVYAVYLPNAGNGGGQTDDPAQCLATSTYKKACTNELCETAAAKGSTPANTNYWQKDAGTIYGMIGGTCKSGTLKEACGCSEGQTLNGTFGKDICMSYGNRVKCAATAQDSLATTTDCTTYSNWKGKYTTTPICTGESDYYQCLYKCKDYTSGQWADCIGNYEADKNREVFCDISAGMDFYVTFTVSGLTTLNTWNNTSIKTMQICLDSNCWTADAPAGPYTQDTYSVNHTFHVSPNDDYKAVGGKAIDSGGNPFYTEKPVQINGGYNFTGSIGLSVDATRTPGKQ